MKKTAKKPAKKSIASSEFYPYRVFFLVLVIAVTCLVLFAAMGVAAEQ